MEQSLRMARRCVHRTVRAADTTQRVASAETVRPAQGSGKTYTMTGALRHAQAQQRAFAGSECTVPPNTYENLSARCCCAAGTDALERDEAGSKGITPRAIAQVFRELRRRQLAHWEVGVTYVQVYNEAFQDLLCSETPEAEIAVSDQRHNPPLILFMHPSRSLARSTFRLLLPRPFNGHADSKSTHCS